MVEKINYYGSVGRRKESIARVRLCQGTGKILINGRGFNDYFPRETHRIVVMKPLEITKTKDRFDVYAKILGGGSSGQAGALTLGIARAILKADETLRITLKRAGLLTRDARVKERKKYGRKRARKSFQFSKR